MSIKHSEPGLMHTLSPKFDFIHDGQCETPIQKLFSSWFLSTIESLPFSVSSCRKVPYERCVIRLATSPVGCVVWFMLSFVHVQTSFLCSLCVRQQHYSHSLKSLYYGFFRKTNSSGRWLVSCGVPCQG